MFEALEGGASAELLRFRSCWRLQFIAQLVGAFDGVYDRAIGTRDLVAQSLRTPAVSSFFTLGRAVFRIAVLDFFLRLPADAFRLFRAIAIAPTRV